MENAKLIISLDCELKWGVFDTLNDSYDENLKGTRTAIKEMLELFKKFDMHVSWAVVGFLFNENRNDYEKYKPSIMPTYDDSKLNSYNCKIGIDEENDNFHYAHDIIKLILSYPNQEIASHSYSHFYCKEDGQNAEQFEADIKSAVCVAKEKFAIDLKSFVFPKNEINEDYLNILREYGFTHFRSNPQHWIYKKGQKTNIFGRVLRFIDSFINITGYNSSNAIAISGLIETTGNRFLRPYKNCIILNKLMIRRIKSEMFVAAKKGEQYHLWWHPHNFGVYTKENLVNLEEIMQYYKILQQRFNMESTCMKKL
ncbi:MAG: polysaccharide deacetylase family protein [Sulfurimonas sp.]